MVRLAALNCPQESALAKQEFSEDSFFAMNSLRKEMISWLALGKVGQQVRFDRIFCNSVQNRSSIPARLRFWSRGERSSEFGNPNAFIVPMKSIDGLSHQHFSLTIVLIADVPSGRIQECGPSCAVGLDGFAK